MDWDKRKRKARSRGARRTHRTIDRKPTARDAEGL
jgi:hypothetical protein